MASISEIRETGEKKGRETQPQRTVLGTTWSHLPEANLDESAQAQPRKKAKVACVLGVPKMLMKGQVLTPLKSK